jgi:tripartite-type tricarboxylate transporter receptor subunit TctC
MKKLLACLGMAVVLSANAGQTVSITWPFAIGANMANSVRLLIDEANKQQSKYTFIFENKPGAGGSIAARYAQGQYPHQLGTVSSSSSFFVRQNFYPNESHKVEDFTPVMIQCTGQPYIIVSNKYKSIDELRQQKRLTIGANLGSLTEAMARQLQQALPNTELDLISYNSGTLQPTQDLLGGVLDLNVDLPGEAIQFVEAGRLNVIGISGTRDYKYYKTFSSQGIKGFEGLVSNYQIAINNQTDPTIVADLHNILVSAAKASKGVQDLYDRDYCSSGINLNLKQTTDMYARWTKYWPEKLQSLKK